MKNKLLVQNIYSQYHVAQNADQKQEKMPDPISALNQQPTTEVYPTNLPSYWALRKANPGENYLAYLESIKKDHRDHLDNHLRNHGNLGEALSLIHIDLTKLDQDAPRKITEWLILNNLWHTPYEDSFLTRSQQASSEPKRFRSKEILQSATGRDIYKIPLSEVIDAIIDCSDQCGAWNRLEAKSTYYYTAAMSYYLDYASHLIRGRIITIENSNHSDILIKLPLLKIMTMLNNFTYQGIRDKLMETIKNNINVENVDPKKILREELKFLCETIGITYSDKPIDEPITQQMLSYSLKTILETVKDEQTFEKASAVLIKIKEYQILQKYMQHIYQVLFVKTFYHDKKNAQKVSPSIEKLHPKNIRKTDFIRNVEKSCEQVKLAFDKPLYPDIQHYEDALKKYEIEFNRIRKKAETPLQAIKDSHTPTSVLRKRSALIQSSSPFEPSSKKRHDHFNSKEPYPTASTPLSLGTRDQPLIIDGSSSNDSLQAPPSHADSNYSAKYVRVTGTIFTIFKPTQKNIKTAKLENKTTINEDLSSLSNKNTTINEQPSCLGDENIDVFRHLIDNNFDSIPVDSTQTRLEEILEEAIQPVSFENASINEQPSFFGNENTTLNTEEPFIDDEDFFRRLLQSTTVNSTPTNSTENTLEEIFKSYNL